MNSCRPARNSSRTASEIASRPARAACVQRMVRMCAFAAPAVRNERRGSSRRARAHEGRGQSASAKTAFSSCRARRSTSRRRPALAAVLPRAHKDLALEISALIYMKDKTVHCSHPRARRATPPHAPAPYLRRARMPPTPLHRQAGNSPSRSVRAPCCREGACAAPCPLGARRQERAAGAGRAEVG